ncbi:prepilin peptidase [Paramicrobacterium chengjingii]|uniref:prepilin peptidase n=1 Tax=Paramicrobacterium chengjingii TaxID=2769067 RepID=UPI0014204944|nr:A24 family peptidase [Microbacterium chengjingii]
MSDPDSTSSDPKPENRTETGHTAPEPHADDQTSPAHGAPQMPPEAQEQPPSTPEPSESAPPSNHSDGAEHAAPALGSQDAAAAPLSNTSPHGPEHASSGVSGSEDAPTEAYPYERQQASWQHSPDHAVTDAYSDSTPTEHVLTGPEPTRAHDTREPAAPAPTAWESSPQHVEVAEAPKRRGNRRAGIGIGIIQALIFAAALFGVLVLLDLLAGEQIDLLGTLLSPALLISVGMFFLALIIVALLVNRAGWWAWILGGLLIAAFAYAGWIGGLLVQEAMDVPSNRVLEFVWDNLLTWPSVAAFILGREVPIWFGAWTSARGRKVAARNRAARDEYDRQLDEGGAAYR